MRAITTNDFESANIEYIQFWVMDPFNADNTNPNSTGELYFNLGNVSEDVLHDNYRSAENGLPAPSTASQNGGHGVPTVETEWGIIPAVQPLVNAFNSDPGDRASQDIGLDGRNSTDENSKFANFLGSIPAAAIGSVSLDPSADDYEYFLSDHYNTISANTLVRYKKFNGLAQERFRSVE